MPEQAGAGSAVNDATRMIGGTLGVAIIGSVYASLYRSSLARAAVPAAARNAARASFAASHEAAARLPGHLGQLLQPRANSGFLDGLHAGCELNNRPRPVLKDQAPAELFAVLLASENPPVLRR